MRRAELDRRIAEKQAQIALYARGTRIRAYIESELRSLVTQRMKRDLRKRGRAA